MVKSFLGAFLFLLLHDSHLITFAVFITFIAGFENSGTSTCSNKEDNEA
jgi:hypothetical protein